MGDSILVPLVYLLLLHLAIGLVLNKVAEKQGKEGVERVFAFIPVLNLLYLTIISGVGLHVLPYLILPFVNFYVMFRIWKAALMKVGYENDLAVISLLVPYFNILGFAYVYIRLVMKK